MSDQRESVREWVRRIGADLELARIRVGGWGEVVVRLGILVDAVDELVSEEPARSAIAGRLSQAREALVAGVGRINRRTGRLLVEEVSEERRAAIERATNRYWTGPNYVPAIVLDERVRSRWAQPDDTVPTGRSERREDES